MTALLPRQNYRFAATMLVAALSLVAVPGAFAAKPGKEEKKAAKREAAMAASDATASTKPAVDTTDAKGKNNGAKNQAGIMDRLRTKLEVTDDEEWTVISARIARVEELQRASWSSGVNNRGGISLGEKKGATSASTNADRESLRTAVADKLPDAEIKSRLSRAHDVRQQGEAALAQAQQDLRSVVSVRQEAVLVIAGLLSP